MSDNNSLSVVMNKRWYAVCTVEKHERLVNWALYEKDIETFLPVKGVVSRWKDISKRAEFPLFPGYVFINTSLGDRHRDILNTRWVVRVLGVNGTPTPVPTDQIDAIRKLLDSRFKYDQYPYCAHGKEVVCMSEPLQGVRGKIIGRRGNYRFILSVDLIQRSVAVAADIKDVELEWADAG